jgi:AbrB family looped-hinge helix DNA binding protein
MTVKIDNAGRVVIPKPVRERLGLKPGSDLELSEGPDGLILKPVVHKAPAMIRERGLWVHQGVPTGTLDLNRAIEQVREERVRDILGL